MLRALRSRTTLGAISRNKLQGKSVSNFEVCVYRSQQLIRQLTIDRSVTVGRQDLKLDDPPPISIHECNGAPRLIVAQSSSKEIPRRWFRLSCDADSRLVLENLHSAYEVLLPGNQSLGIGETRYFGTEVLVDLGLELVLRVAPSDIVKEVTSDGYQQLESVPPTPGRDITFARTLSLRQLPETSGKATVDLLKVALQVVQRAAGSDAFFQKAVEATAQIVELDRAMILMRSDAAAVEEIANCVWLHNGWCTVADYLAPWVESVSRPDISSSILARLSVSDSKTIIHNPISSTLDPEYAPSLDGIHCVVASPILNTKSELIGVLYGDRWTQQEARGESRISELEATLVEVLAGAVSGGVARKSEERQRANLSGFFSPRVADLLAMSPELLSGQDVEISVLFCDIRGFSSVTETLGPKKTIEWINDVLSALSQHVVDSDGVLVDYVGDELMAMWGAPSDQPDHARRAVETAIQMLKSIEVLRQRWSEILPLRFGAGIGVNTGPARVGNVGSRLKFKYGVLGNTVNIGSRLQAATKQLGVDCMVSQQTAIEANCVDQSRRLARLGVVGIESAIDVYQVVHKPDPGWKFLIHEYEAALSEFEEGRFGASASRLGNLIQSQPNDRPSRQLLARAAEQLSEPSDNFSNVWKLSRK